MSDIGLVISTLTSRLKAQVESTRLRERTASALYELGKQLSAVSGNAFLVSAAGEKIAELTDGEVAIYVARATGVCELAYGQNTSIPSHPVRIATAHWMIDHDQIAGAGTNMLPNAADLFIPLMGLQRTHGPSPCA